jgi:hypothetical protein
MQPVRLIAPITSETVLAAETELIMLGSDEQRTAFTAVFGRA